MCACRYSVGGVTLYYKLVGYNSSHVDMDNGHFPCVYDLGFRVHLCSSDFTWWQTSCSGIRIGIGQWPPCGGSTNIMASASPNLTSSTAS